MQNLTIKQYFQNTEFNPKNLRKYLKQHIEEYQYLKQLYKNYTNFSFFYFVKFYINNTLNNTCVICGKKLNQQQLRKNKKYCSSKCSANSQQNKTKHQETNIKKFGTTCTLQSKKIKQLCKQKNIQKFGVENPFYSKQIQAKIKKKKSQKSEKQKYDQINKRKQTNLKKYNNICPMQGEQLKQRIKQTYLQKYGTDHPLRNKQILNKVIKNRLANKFKKFVDTIKNYVIPLFNIDEYDGTQSKKIYKWKCVKCGNQFECHIKTSTFDKVNNRTPRCLKCYPYIGGYSYQQKQVIQFIKSITKLQLIERSRNIIQPYELDIYIPQKNIAIEYNGLYWHQDIIEKTSLIKKTELCIQKNIQLIHIFQDEWLYKQDIVKDRIKNILGIYEKRIYARKCKIEEINSNICKDFLNTNHIQGNDNSKIRLGLFYENELVSVMTFSKPRFNKNYQFELVRFASKLGYQVIGGASKLLKDFERNYHPKSLISYADRRYSNGKLYYALGFQFLNNSEPNYCWYKNHTKYTRYQCQKHKLKNILEQNFNPQLSQSQNMYFNGAGKIYDCGNSIFIKQYSNFLNDFNE